MLDAPGPVRGKVLSKAALALIERALGTTEQLMRSTADQVFVAVKDCLLFIIDDMHSAGYGGGFRKGNG